MPYGALALDTISTSGNLAIEGNVEVSSNVTVGADLFVSGSQVEPLVLATAKTATGTAVDFAGIPSWVKRITISFNGVSTSGSSYVEVRLGTTSGFVFSGYISYSSFNGSTNGNASVTDGFTTDSGGPTASTFRYGHMILTLLDPSSNLWVSSHIIGQNIVGAGIWVMHGGGRISLPSALTQLRLTTVNGTDTFDAGTVNIMYE